MVQCSRTCTCTVGLLAYNILINVSVFNQPNVTDLREKIFFRLSHQTYLSSSVWVWGQGSEERGSLHWAAVTGGRPLGLGQQQDVR